MLSKEERMRYKIRCRDIGHFYYRLHERGCELFGSVTPKDMLKECFDSIKDAKKSIIIKDDRGKDSTHHCLFISDNGGYVCIPCCINEDTIILNTIKDIKQDESPLWYVRSYNNLARERDLIEMSPYACQKIIKKE